MSNYNSQINPKQVLDLFYLSYLYIYPPESQESDGGANT